MQEVATLGERLSDVQAVGETGLDFVHGPAREVQFGALRAQLRIARERGLPVVLHCVRAFEPLMRELAACEPRAVIFHGFIGSPEQAQQAPCERLFPLVRRTRLRIAQNACGAARNAPVSALSGDRRQPRTDRGNLCPGGEARGVPAEELQPGDAGELQTDI